MTEKTPKLKVGDVVTHKPDLFGMTQSTVIEVEKLFQDIDPSTGKFNRGGLCHIERDIASIQIPFEFDGKTLTIHYPQHDFGNWIEKAYTKVAKFKGFGYTTQNQKMCTFWDEKSLKLVK